MTAKMAVEDEYLFGSAKTRSTDEVALSSRADTFAAAFFKIGSKPGKEGGNPGGFGMTRLRRAGHR